MVGYPGLPESNIAPRYLIPCGILLAIALPLCCARIYTRAIRKRLFADDYIVAVGTVLCTAGYVLNFAASFYGWGDVVTNLTLEHQVLVGRIFFSFQLLGVFTACLIRISVAWSLIRLSSNQLWRAALITIIGLQCLSSSIWIIMMFARCRPVQANWDYFLGGDCWPIQATTIFGWICTCEYILVDFMLAVMPIRLICQLHRPVRERILIGCLMAMGLVATAIAATKTKLYSGIGVGILWQNTVEPNLYTKLEELIGIIAACVPCLKAPAERLLIRLGVLSSNIFRSTMTTPSFVRTPSTQTGGIQLSRVTARNRDESESDEPVEVAPVESNKSTSEGSVSDVNAPAPDASPAEERKDGRSDQQTTVASAESRTSGWQAV